MEDYSETGLRRVLRNLLKGASYLCIFGNPHRHRDSLYSETNLIPEQRDAIALSSDWQQVGKDLWAAIEELEKQLESEKKL